MALATNNMMYSDSDDVEDDEDGEEHCESASESLSAEFSPSMLTKHSAPSTSLCVTDV